MRSLYTLSPSAALPHRVDQALAVMLARRHEVPLDVVNSRRSFASADLVEPVLPTACTRRRTRAPWALLATATDLLSQQPRP